MNIWERTRQALAPLGVPTAANVMITASGEALPDLYLVYQMISDPPALHGDDDELARQYRMQVTCYSRGGLEGLPDVIGAMKAAGYTRAGSRELPYNDTTRHYGLAMDFYYLEDTNG